MSDNGFPRTFELIDAHSLNRDAQNYEFLKGGRGREIFFRQQRYRVSEMLKDVKHLNPRVISEHFEGDLVDIAITGESCRCAGQAPVKPGDELPKVWVMIGDSTYYAGRARIVHASHQEEALGKPEHTLVGLFLMDEVMDIDRIFRLRTEAQTENHMKSSKVLLSREDIVPEYKRLVADFLFLLTRYRSLLMRQEELLESSAPEARAEIEKELLHTVWDSFCPLAKELQQRMEDVVNPNIYDPDFRDLYRAYTLSLITPHLAAGPNWWRAWVKPLGYPGDYLLMNQFYAREWEGDNLFAKLAHRYGSEQMMVKAVCSRMDFLRDAVFRIVEEQAGQGEGPIRILCLGSGPVREIIEFAKAYDGDRRVEFTLLDQDNSALSFANRKLSPLVVKSEERVHVRYLYLAFRQLFGDDELFQSTLSSNLVYSAGLFDYLSTGKAKLLVSKLWSKLPRGGKLLVGNFAGPPEHAWAPSLVLDWDLRYRTREEMEDLGSELDDASSVEVVTEELGLQFFIEATKRAE